jgi:hypothetical protein
MGNVRRLLAIVVGLSALSAPGAAAEPASGPHETVDQTFTATAPGTPTGLGYSGTYHAAGDPDGNPPFMRRMTFHPPSGMHFDTSAPERCTASDAELQLRGPDACPPGSRLGGGTADGIVFVPFTGGELDHYHHNVYVLNNTNEQILLVEAEGYSVTRGQVHPHGSVEFNAPTCFPTPPTGQCADDHVLQLGSSTTIPVYTRSVDGVDRSYATTPATCPASGRWESTIEFWWDDGSVDNVVTGQPCSPPGA